MLHLAVQFVRDLSSRLRVQQQLVGALCRAIAAILVRGNDEAGLAQCLDLARHIACMLAPPNGLSAPR